MAVAVEQFVGGVHRRQLGAVYLFYFLNSVLNLIPAASLAWYIDGVVRGNTHVYAQYTIRVAERKRVAEALKAQGIPTAVYYPKCLHEQPVFEPLGYRWGDFPEAERASREVLSLPMHPYLTEREQKWVVDALRSVIQ